MTYHRPVLLDELLGAAGRPSRVVDATLGDGGHAEALLRAGAEVRVIGEDGWCTPLTRDYRPQRTNLYLENGLVVRSSMG